MSDDSHDWLVLHRVVFDQEINGIDAPFPGPSKAIAWCFYPTSPVGENGFRTSISREWGGFGIYSSRQDAEDVYENPQDHLSFLGQNNEQWHALLVPYAHRGRVNWRGELRDESTFHTAKTDPGGPLLVLTSAGYENPGPQNKEKITNFLNQVENVLEFYATLSDNIRSVVYNGFAVDGCDGMTVSIWKSDDAMMEAAYQPGFHREQMDYQRSPGHFDRSSFTRTRIVASKGAWNGSDPVAEIA